MSLSFGGVGEADRVVSLAGILTTDLLNQSFQIIKPEVIMNIAQNTEHKEGKVARAIEKQTAKIPSDVYLWASLGSMAISLGLKIAGKKTNALFVGQWAAPFLLLGVYNKLVKLQGSDKEDNE